MIFLHSAQNKIYVDANYYYNWYTNFIGFINGVDATPDPVFSNRVYIHDVYRIATNSTKIITIPGIACRCAVTKWSGSSIAEA